MHEIRPMDAGPAMGEPAQGEGRRLCKTPLIGERSTMGVDAAAHLSGADHAAGPGEPSGG